MTGDGSLTPMMSAYATPVVNTSNVQLSMLSIGEDHACASNVSGVVCWGTMQSPALGVMPGSKTFNTVTLPVGSITGLATGTSHTCAIVENNVKKPSVFCWGDNSKAQLGNLNKSLTYSPVMVTLAPE